MNAAALAPAEPYVLLLFVAGTTPNSVRAIGNTRRFCEQHLQGRYQLTIIDIYQQPELARSEQIIAVPTLLRKQPQPLRRLIGDLADVSRLLLPAFDPAPILDATRDAA